MDKAVVDFLKTQFDNILKDTSPLAKSFTPGLDFHLRNFSAVYASSPEIYGLSAEPCLIPFFTPELVEKYMAKNLPDREKLTEELNQYIRTFPKCALHSYFTAEGLLNFLSTGYIQEFPPALYASPLEMPDRIRLVKKLCEQIKKGSDLRMMKGALDKFPTNLHLTITSSYGYLMFARQDQELLYILLKEQNILNSFHDFACSLEENEMLKTPKETLEYVQAVLQQYPLSL